MLSESVVHVIDDDDAARDALRFLLESAQLTARTYESATAFLAQLPRIEPGCIVTDVRMPEVSGIELLRRLNHATIQMPVIVITGHGDIALAVEAMKLGACDFFEKPYDDEALLCAVRAAMNRQEDEAERESAKADIVNRINELTARERQVLNGLVAGKPNKNIAFDLEISPRTVEIYRANVMTKMKASSLSEVVRMALNSGQFDGTPLKNKA
jgi:two-component system, LuxR family, response regulator FixJ